MTHTETLRLALEALEKISRTQYHIETPPIESLEEKMRRIADKAITAIKAALEAKDEPVTVYGYCPICNAEGLSRERHPDGSDVCTNGHIYKSKDALTTPPQRTWVGLTDEEIDELWESTASYYNTHDFARAIEAKLKEKNT